MTASTGCMLGWYDANGYSNTNGLGDMETNLGTRFAVVRVYNQWWPDHSGTITTATNAGRLVLSSHKPPKHANSWVEIARGDYDADITSMVNFYKGLAPAEVVFIFNHEPHTSGSDAANKAPTYGKMADFVQAYRRIAKAFRAANATNVKLGYCAVANYWAARGTPYGVGDAGYPGDDVVDVLCHDDYNWFNNFSASNWDSMQTVMEKTVAIAKRLHKPVIFGEMGSQWGHNTQDRDAWFRDGALYLKNNPDARIHVLGFCYYHVDNHNNSGHYWRFAQGAHTDGRQGYIDGFVKDPYFLTRPIPVSLRTANSNPNSGGVPPQTGTGSHTATPTSGPRKVTSVGGIPSPADFQDPEESPGLDFGTAMVGVSAAGLGAIPSRVTFGPTTVFMPGHISAVGIPSQIVFGAAVVTRGTGIGWLFIPPVRYINPPVLPDTRGIERRLFRYYGARPVGSNVYVMNNGTVTENPPDLNDVTRVYHGGHEIPITDTEYAVLVSAGYGADMTALLPPPVRTWGLLGTTPWGEFGGYTWGEIS